MYRAKALKKVLWDMFSQPCAEAGGAARLDLRAVLLYLCTDRDQFQAIKKAFSVAAKSIADNARATAEQVFKVGSDCFRGCTGYYSGIVIATSNIYMACNPFCCFAKHERQLYQQSINDVNS